jgi:DNA-directed RNA polymerase alpha subunit
MKRFLYPTPALPDDTPLEHVHFSTRIRNALEFGGLKTAGDVRAASDDVLLSFQNLGHGSVHHLRETLGLKASK